MSMNFNNNNNPTQTPNNNPTQPPKKNNTKTIIYAIITAVVVISITGFFINMANKMNDNMVGSSSVSSNIISGEYDTILRQKCIERLNSYGLGAVPEGSINLCVDTAKAIAYHELNK